MTEAYHLNALPKGTMLQEYEVLRVLGEGSFGIVYLAKGRYLDDHVAIKEYLPKELATRAGDTSVAPTSSSSERDFLWGRQKFLEEARLLWQLGNPKPHPNIVAVRRFFELHATAYLVMDFEQGEPLSAVIKRDGPLPEERVWSLLHPLLDGLEAVHAAGITHRDVKPDNIFVRNDGTPVLLDFGAARLALGERTQSAFNAMSPAYAATEQLMGSDRIGPWTDIYGLGATLYRAVTGELPQPPLERLVEERHRSAVDVAGARCGRPLLEGIDAAMALRPEDRPQTIADWRARLLTQRSADAEEKTTVIPKAVIPKAAGPEARPVRAERAPLGDRAAREPIAEPQRRRHPTAGVLLGLVAALAIGVVAYLLTGPFGFDPASGPTASLGDAPSGQTAEESSRQQTEEEARRQAEAKARHLAEVQVAREAEARRLAEVQAAREAEAEAARKAEARRLAEAAEAREKARRQAELEARRQAELEARRQAELEAERQAELEAQRQAELEAQREAALEAQRQAELEAQQEAALEAQRQAALEAQRQAELEAQRQAEAAARRRAEQEAARKVEQDARRLSQVVAFEKFLFAAKNTNVRTTPSVDSDKLAMIAAGSGVLITGGLPDGSWYRVRLANGIDGFVWSELLTPQPPVTSTTSDPARGTTKSDATPTTSAVGDAHTRKSSTDPEATQEAVARQVPDPAETLRRVAELERFIDSNPRDAELAFRDFTAREGMFDHAERFRRVISFDDISFSPPRYKISVHYSYCYLKNGCQVLSDSGLFAAQFDGGKLTFLGEADAPAR